MRRAALILAALAVTPASARLAWPCPHGQLFRVHLRQCVDLHSKLAWAFERITPRRPAPVDLPAPEPAERPIPLPVLERPAELPAFVLPPVAWPSQ